LLKLLQIKKGNEGTYLSPLSHPKFFRTWLSTCGDTNRKWLQVQQMVARRMDWSERRQHCPRAAGWALAPFRCHIHCNLVIPWRIRRCFIRAVV